MTDLRKTVGSLDNLVAFEAAARHANFSRAARELMVAQPAISRRIQQLEEALGANLFERHGTRIKLTPAGHQFHGTVTSALHGIEQAARALPRDDDGVVSLRVSVAASLWLMPALGEFYESCPDIRLHLVCIDEIPELGGVGDFDLEIRFGLGSWPDVESYSLLDETVYPVAAPSLFRSHGLDCLENISRAPLLQVSNFVSPLMNWENWFDDASSIAAPTTRYFTTYAMLLEAAVCGHGVALGWDYYVRSSIERGELVKLPVEERQSNYHEFLIVRNKVEKRQSVERTKNWIIAFAHKSRSLRE